MFFRLILKGKTPQNPHHASNHEGSALGFKSMGFMPTAAAQNGQMDGQRVMGKVGLTKGRSDHDQACPWVTCNKKPPLFE